MDEHHDAVTAHEAKEMARAAIKQIWKRRLGKPLFPDFYAFENQFVYVFGYTTSQWHGGGARYEHPGVFVPVVNKRDGALHLEPSGAEFFRHYPDLTRIPDSELLAPMTWRPGPAERLGLAGKQITPYEGLQITRSIVERFWKRKWGDLMFPVDGGREFDEFYTYSYGARQLFENHDMSYMRFGAVRPLIRKCDGAVHSSYYPLPLSVLFPDQERPIPAELLRAP